MIYLSIVVVIVELSRRKIFVQPPLNFFLASSLVRWNVVYLNFF